MLSVFSARKVLYIIVKSSNLSFSGFSVVIHLLAMNHIQNFAGSQAVYKNDTSKIFSRNSFIDSKRDKSRLAFKEIINRCSFDIPCLFIHILFTPGRE